MHAPKDLDEIGKAQIAALEALQAQLLLSMKTRFRFAGVEFVGQFSAPETDDQELIGWYWGIRSALHSLGGAHFAVLHEFGLRKAGVAEGRGNDHV